MNYASIRRMDISNGEGIGVALFVQGCPIHCEGCFNQIAWDFEGGKVFDEKAKERFIDMASRDYVERITILGGEPMAEQNVAGVNNLVNEIRARLGNTRKIWLYSGYTYEHLSKPHRPEEKYLLRNSILSNIDVLVDGKYESSLRDLNLKYRGSSNQRVINVPKTIETNEITLYIK